MDVSTKKVLERTLSITNTHPESDQSGSIEEKWGDISIDYKGYTKYDEVEVITNVSISEDEKIAMRHTHLYIPENINEEIESITDYYIENKIGPFANCFRVPEQDPEPEPEYIVIDLCDGETGVDNIEATFMENAGLLFFNLNINRAGAEAPQVHLLTRTVSKTVIEPNNIVHGESKIIVEAGQLPQYLESADLEFEFIEEKDGTDYYHVFGNLKDNSYNKYVIDDVLPLVAYDENGERINITDIETYEPTTEEIQLVEDLLDVLNGGEMPAGETRFDVSTKGTTTTITINEENELTNIVLPEDLGQTVKINGSIKSGTSITYNTPGKKTLYVTNTSSEPVDIILESTGTLYLNGEYEDIVLNGTQLSSATTTYPNIHGNVIISDDVSKAVTINANFVGEPNNTIISNTDQPITITAKNASANIDVECPNSTVTLGGGSYGDVTANVAPETLKLTINTFIDKLNLKSGNIHINNGKNIINNLVKEINCDYEYTVSYNKANALPSSPVACEYTLAEDKDAAVIFSALASGDTVINLNGHTIHGNTTRNAALYVRGKAVVEINGEGNVVNDLAYTVWNSESGVVNINGGTFTGATHTIYCYKGEINIYGGEFILTAGDVDTKGHWKFLLNCYDANFTAGTAKIKVYGGKYYNFNPAEAYGEPVSPFNYVAEGYKSVCIDEEQQIYEVRPVNTITIVDTKNNTIEKIKVALGEGIALRLFIDPIPTYPGYLFNGADTTETGTSIWPVNEYGWLKWDNEYIDNTGYWIYGNDLTLYIMWKENN